MKRGTVGPVETLFSGEIRRQAGARLTIATPGPGFTEFTDAVAAFVRGSGVRDGVATVFCRHTSASLTIQENADPDVQADLMTALDGLAPRHVAYVHGAEGPDDMPAHLRSMLTQTQLSIPVEAGRMALGTWQAVYLFEHRRAPHRRELALHLLAD